MSYEQVDFASHVGQEVDLDLLFRSAWRTFKRHGWPALGYGILMWLLAMAAALAAMFLSMILALPLNLISRGSSSPMAAMGGSLAGQIMGSLVGAAATALFTFPLIAGYVWSVVCTYDDRRMEAGDLFAGFRSRYKLLVTLGAIQGLALCVIQIMQTVFTAGATLSLMRSGGPPGLPAVVGVLASILPALVVAMVAMWIVQLLFFLTPYFAFAHEAPTWRLCLQYNWRVLRERPGQFLLVFFASTIGIAALTLLFGIPVSLTCLLFLTREAVLVFLAVVLLGIEGLALVACVVALMVYAFFLIAGFFRAAYGYSLHPPDAAPLRDAPPQANVP